MRTRWTGFQSALASGIEQYLAFKRALGRRFASEERALRLLDRFLIERGVDDPKGITPELLESFLASRPRMRPRSYNTLLGLVRRLMEWLGTQGVLDIPPLRLKPRRQTDFRLPFLFDPPLARRMLQIAASFPDGSRSPLRGPTYRTILALLYGLGLRVNEVAKVACGDVDLDRCILLVRHGKFGKTRLLPFGPQIAALLRGYLGAKQSRGISTATEAPLFSFVRHRPIGTNTIQNFFRDQLLPRLDLTVPEGVKRPQVHGLRHSFAVGVLLRWYREGLNPAVRLPHLSTFMGHVNLRATSVYLTVTADLLREANNRFEAYARPSVSAEVQS